MARAVPRSPTPAWRSVPAAAVLALGALLCAGPAQAGLFDDDEARRAILDIRAKITAGEEAQRSQAATLRQLQDQIQQLQRSLLELNNQNETLRGEVARMRGQDEQMQRDLAEAQRKLKDMAQGVEDRMRKLEPQPVSLDGRDFTAEPDEKKAYEDAMQLLRSGDFERASAALSAFLKRYPASGYNESVRYWLGNSLYGKRDYKEAIATFRSFVTTSPESVRAPEALLAMANCQIELKDPRTAKKTLEELLKLYPKSEAAQAARERLVAMK